MNTLLFVFDSIRVYLFSSLPRCTQRVRNGFPRLSLGLTAPRPFDSLASVLIFV